MNLGAVLREILLRDLPPTVLRDERGRHLIRPHELNHADYVGRAFDQIRVAGAHQPTVAQYLLETLGLLRGEVEQAGLADRAEPLRRQARLVLTTCRSGSPLPEDLDQVVAAARRAGFDTV